MHVPTYVYAHAHLFLLSASKCLESLLKKEELAGLEDFKRSLPTSMILRLQILVIASNHCESLVTWCSVDKKETLNHTLTSSHLCHFEKLRRHMKPLLTKAHDQMSVWSSTSALPHRPEEAFCTEYVRLWRSSWETLVRICGLPPLISVTKALQHSSVQEAMDIDNARQQRGLAQWCRITEWGAEVHVSRTKGGIASRTKTFYN